MLRIKFTRETSPGSAIVTILRIPPTREGCLHKPIPFAYSNSLIVADRRYICLVCSIHNVQFLLVELYIPPLYSGEILKKVLAFVDASPVAPILLVGDFNNHLHPYWDKFHSGSIDPDSLPTSLARVLDKVGLRDVWRLQFPTTRLFSCYSSFPCVQ